MLVAHNTLSSYAPKGVLSKIFNKFAKCQNCNIQELWDKGVRGFDLRFRIDKNNCIQPCHGLVDYNIDIYNILNIIKTLNKNDEKVFIRIINEDTFHKSNVDRFEEIVHFIMMKYYNFDYKIYNSKKNWTCSFNEIKNEEIEFASSKLTPRILPIEFAKLFNNSIKRLMQNNKNIYVYLDFI